MSESGGGESEEDKRRKEQREALAEGIISMLSPVVTELDARVQATRQSQIHLRSQIDELAENLRTVSDSQEPPFPLDAYVKKLQESRKRIAVVSSILHNTQERLGRLQGSIAKETAKRKSMLEPPVPAPPT